MIHIIRKLNFEVNEKFLIVLCTSVKIFEFMLFCKLYLKNGRVRVKVRNESL